MLLKWISIYSKIIVEIIIICWFSSDFVNNFANYKLFFKFKYVGNYPLIQKFCSLKKCLILMFQNRLKMEAYLPLIFIPCMASSAEYSVSNIGEEGGTQVCVSRRNTLKCFETASFHNIMVTLSWISNQNSNIII